MDKRWIVASAAALAIALLTVPMLIGRGKVGIAEPALVPSHGSAAGCKAQEKAKLDVTLKDMNGANVRLADYKGNVILINYWATWCGPCRVEIPGFVELYDQYKDKGLVILGVSTDDDPETLRAYAKELKMNYPVLVGRDNEPFLDAFGPLWGLPTSFFIGRDGSICGKHLGPATKEDFEKAIQPLL